MNKLELGKYYILNPFYHLRHDIHRVVLFTKGGTDNLCSRNWCTFIHPLQAVFLSFFTHKRTLEENINLLSDYFFKTKEEIGQWVSEYINNPYPIYSNSRQGKIYFPKRVLIGIDEIKGNVKYLQLNANQFLWKRLDLTTRRLYTGPLIVTFMLNNHCMTQCKYCYADTVTKVKKVLEISQWLELICEASKLDVQQIYLMGGEVFLYNNWSTILKELVKLDIAPEFISTKVPPTEELVIKLQECGYKGILQISLDACNDEILSESIRTNHGYVKSMITGLHLLDDYGIKYQIATVLTKYNCHITILEKMYAELSKLKCIHDWRIVPVNNSITKNYNVFKKLKPTKKELLDIFYQMEFIIKKHKGFNIILGKENVYKQYQQTNGGSYHFKGSDCSALTSHLFVLPDGKVTICEQLYWNPRFIIGDVNIDTLTEIWNSPKILELYAISQKEISPNSYCSQCKFFEECFSYHNRCWSDVIKSYGKECWDYPDPRCIYAPNMKNNLGYE